MNQKKRVTPSPPIKPLSQIVSACGLRPEPMITYITCGDLHRHAGLHRHPWRLPS